MNEWTNHSNQIQSKCHYLFSFINFGFTIKTEAGTKNYSEQQFKLPRIKRKDVTAY